MRDFRLIKPHDLAGFNLRQPSHANRALNQLHEVGLSLLKHRVRKPEVLKDVAGSYCDLYLLLLAWHATHSPGRRDSRGDSHELVAGERGSFEGRAVESQCHDSTILHVAQPMPERASNFLWHSPKLVATGAQEHERAARRCVPALDICRIGHIPSRRSEPQHRAQPPILQQHFLPTRSSSAPRLPSRRTGPTFPPCLSPPAPPRRPA